MENTTILNKLTEEQFLQIVQSGEFNEDLRKGCYKVSDRHCIRFEAYNYSEVIANDIVNEFAGDFEGYQSLDESELIERLRNSDSVTGNMSGSYFCNSWKAEEAIAHNWSLLADVCKECEEGLLDPAKGAERYDAIIRYYLTHEIARGVLDLIADFAEASE